MYPTQTCHLVSLANIALLIIVNISKCTIYLEEEHRIDQQKMSLKAHAKLFQGMT